MSNPRIIAGSAKNKRLLVPESARPMTDRIKQSVFDLLGERILDANVADLFAGSGNLGIEALSRGAKSCSFTELNSEAAGIIKENLVNTGFTNSAKVISKKAESFLNQTEELFDIIFVDPPFPAAHKFDPKRLLSNMHNDSVAVFRLPSSAPEIEFGEEFELLHSQKYGESRLYFLAKSV